MLAWAVKFAIPLVTRGRLPDGRLLPARQRGIMTNNWTAITRIMPKSARSATRGMEACRTPIFP
jgi:hypothetical protein